MLLTVSFWANGQQGSDDSITVSVSSVRRAIQADIKREKAEKENEYLKASNENLKILNKKTEDFNLSLQEQRKDYELRWKECMKASDIVQEQHNKRIEELQKYIKRNKFKNTIGFAGTSAIIVALTYLLIIK